MQEVKQLGRITNEIIDGWATRFVKKDGHYCCKGCGGTIIQTTCYVSIHLKLFKTCAGSGEVQKINYPYCPKCDGEIECVQACYHI